MLGTKATKMIIMHIFMTLGMSGLGSNLNDMKARIQRLQAEISQLGAPEPVMPEMIDATNAIRLNAYLTKSDEKKTALNAAYSDYAENLEGIVSTLLSIQADLKDIIKTEASLLDEQESRTKKRAKKPAK